MTWVAQTSALEVCGFSAVVHPIVGSTDHPMMKEIVLGSYS